MGMSMWSISGRLSSHAEEKVANTIVSHSLAMTVHVEQCTKLSRRLKYNNT